MLGDIVKEVLENYDYRIMSHQKQKQALKELQQMQDIIKELEEELQIQHVANVSLLTENANLREDRDFRVKQNKKYRKQLEQQKKYVELGKAYKAYYMSNNVAFIYLSSDDYEDFEEQLLFWYREQKRQENA